MIIIYKYAVLIMVSGTRPCDLVTCGLEPDEAIKNKMTTVFAMPVFDATVIFEGNELFKGKGSAQMWAEKLAAEIGSEVTVQKIGTGWVLCGRVDGNDCVYGIHGQRLKQVSNAA